VTGCCCWGRGGQVAGTQLLSPALSSSGMHLTCGQTVTLLAEDSHTSARLAVRAVLGCQLYMQGMVWVLSWQPHQCQVFAQGAAV
jgi:hypothetical protein